MTRKLWLMVVVAAAMIGQAEAGVRGGRFEGTLAYSDGTDAGYLYTDFFQNGEFSEAYGDFENTGVYPGSFTEIEFVVLSFWSATYDEYPNYEINGICLFGFVSLYHVAQTDGQNDYSGVVFRTGLAGGNP